MASILRKIFDGIQEDLGVPARLHRLIESTPELRVQLQEPARNIDANSVVNWDSWGATGRGIWDRGAPGRLQGWKAASSDYISIDLAMPYLKNIGFCRKIESWTCEIQDVHGFSSSKSILADFKSMDEMVERNSRSMIDEITNEKLQQNLEHDDIRIIHHPNNDHFSKHLWDGRVFLRNGGGSHHFAAARYIAKRLNKPVSLTGSLYVYGLNEDSVRGLCSDYEIFAISDKDSISNEFHASVRSFGATYLWHILPKQYHEIRAIFLPRNESRSMKVAKALRNSNNFDLGNYLLQICLRQTD